MRPSRLTGTAVMVAITLPGRRRRRRRDGRPEPPRRSRRAGTGTRPGRRRRPASSKRPAAEGEQRQGPGPAHRRRDCSGPRDLALPRTPARRQRRTSTGDPGPNASPPTSPNSPPAEVGARRPRRAAPTVVVLRLQETTRYVTRTVNLDTGEGGVDRHPARRPAAAQPRRGRRGGQAADRRPAGRRAEGQDYKRRHRQGPHRARTSCSVTGFVYRGRRGGRGAAARSATAASTAASGCSPRSRTARGSTPAHLVIDLSARTVAPPRLSRPRHRSTPHHSFLQGSHFVMRVNRRSAGARRPHRAPRPRPRPPWPLGATAGCGPAVRPGRPEGRRRPRPPPTAAPPTASSRSSPAARPGACAGTTRARPASSWTTSRTSPRAKPARSRSSPAPSSPRSTSPTTTAGTSTTTSPATASARACMNLDPGECPGGTIKTVKVPGRLGPAHPDVKRPVHHHPRPRPRLPHAGRRPGEQQGLPAQGKDLLRLHRQPGRLVRVHHRVALLRTTAPSPCRSAPPAASRPTTTTPVTAAAGRSARAPRTTPPATATTSSGGSTSASTAPPQDQGRAVRLQATTAAAGGQAPTTKTTRTPGHQGTGRATPASMRWWRVVSAAGKNKDGHPRSYEIVPGPHHQVPGPQLTPSTTSTSPSTTNASSSPATTWRNCGAGAGKSVDKWVNGQTAHAPRRLGQHRLPPHRPGRGPAADAGPLAGLPARPARRHRYESAHSARARPGRTGTTG